MCRNELELIVTETLCVLPILLRFYANPAIRAYKYFNPYKGSAATAFIAGGMLSTSILTTGETQCGF